MVGYGIERTPQWALDQINDAYTMRLTELDLRKPTWETDDNVLTMIPQETFELTWLESLDISGNRIVSIQEEVVQMSQLRTIDLRNNLLKNFPVNITRLSNLRSLDLSENQLTYLSDEIGQLTKLEWLNLGDNQLDSVPSTFFHLTNLSSLDLRLNYFSTIPDNLAQLTNLASLDLGNNMLESVPYWLSEHPKLEWLNLEENPITSPPPEVLKLGEYGPVDFDALRAYFRQQEEAGQETLYEAKLLIVGEPGSGKTSLTRKLINPEAAFLLGNKSTEGIDVHVWTFPLVDNEPASKLNSSTNSPLRFRANIWDFGGQEIYHATHQFFLSRRSLYVVVADAREQKTDFFHWLDLIEHLSERSPVLIFNNEIQDRHWAINEQQLKAHFPETLQKPFAFNLLKDSVGLQQLRQKIQKLITTLPHVGDVLPRTWAKVRRALEKDSRPTVTIQDFLQLCKKNGFKRREDALQLSGYLHDIGIILHFQDDPLLKKTVILKPEWGTSAVYRVLDNDQVKASFGHFDRDDLREIWYEDEYSLLDDELLALMMKFQLCYAIPGQTDQYIAPQLLGEIPPDYQFAPDNPDGIKKRSLHLRFKYEAFMPKGLITRFIVAMHSYIAMENKQLVWRTGVVLEKDDARAEVVEFYHHREIRVRVTGKNQRDLLTIIGYELDKLHRPFYRLKFDKLIPCNCTNCRKNEKPHFFKLDTLKTRLEYSKEVIECDTPPFETVQIRSLLDDVGAKIQLTDVLTLLRNLNRAFSEDDFKTVCLELSINYDNLSGEGLEGKQREFLLKLERNGRLPELIHLLRQKRPNFNW